MRIELILLGVIAIVLIVDFILRGIKKKDTTEKGLEKFEGAFEESIKQSKFNYISSRKRNILTFILLVMLFKPIFHYVFVEEKGEITENVVNLGIKSNELYLKSRDGKLYKGRDNDGELFTAEAYKRLERTKKWNRMTKGAPTVIIWNQTENDYWRDGLFKKNGDEILENKDGEKYYYLRANPTLKSYYTKYYKSKPYFFAISLGGLLILVFLFNDKIKAR